MKILLLLILLATSSLSQAQYKLSSNPGRTDYKLCQENHNIILDKFISQANTQIHRLMNGIDHETKFYSPEFKIKAYQDLLADLIVKKILLKEIKRQLNVTTLDSYFAVKGNWKIDYLNTDKISIDLERQFNIELKEIKNIIVGNTADVTFYTVKSTIIKNAISTLATKKFQKIGAGIFARILAGRASELAGSGVLKSAVVSFGSGLFVSAATGFALDILTFPLHAYRLPPETLWTDLLNKNPEIIIIPEWMKKGGIQDHPWSTHCNAIQRRTDNMVDRLKTSLKKDEMGFISEVQRIDGMEEIVDKKQERSVYAPKPMAIDNTYVKPVQVYFISTPEWARLKK